MFLEVQLHLLPPMMGVCSAKNLRCIIIIVAAAIIIVISSFIMHLTYIQVKVDDCSDYQLIDDR